MFKNTLVIVNINFSSGRNEKDHNLKGIEERKRRVGEKQKEKLLVDCWERVHWWKNMKLMLVVIQMENFGN